MYGIILKHRTRKEKKKSKRQSITLFRTPPKTAPNSLLFPSTSRIQTPPNVSYYCLFLNFTLCPLREEGLRRTRPAAEHYPLPLSDRPNILLNAPNFFFLPVVGVSDLTGGILSLPAVPAADNAVAVLALLGPTPTANGPFG